MSALSWEWPTLLLADVPGCKVLEQGLLTEQWHALIDGVEIFSQRPRLRWRLIFLALETL